MKTKIIQSIPAILALCAIGFLYFGRWCTETISSCYGSWVDHVYFYFTQPLYFFALYFLPVAIILIFVSHHIFVSWWKIASLMLIVAFLFAASQPVAASLFSTNRDDAARFAAEILDTLSLILIVWKSIAARRTK